MSSARVPGVPKDSRFSPVPVGEPIRYGSWDEFFQHIVDLAQRKGTTPARELEPVPLYLTREFGPMPTPPWESPIS
jgi:hypothetical protein